MSLGTAPTSPLAKITDIFIPACPVVPPTPVLYAETAPKKASVFSTEASFGSPVNDLDGLNTATLFAVRYGANTKFRCPHGRNLLFGF